jgi:hypothetical protein
MIHLTGLADSTPFRPMGHLADGIAPSLRSSCGSERLSIFPSGITMLKSSITKISNIRAQSTQLPVNRKQFEKSMRSASINRQGFRYN